MDATKSEKEPLIKPEVQELSKVDVAVPVPEGAVAHEFDGHLLCFLGRCDSPGVLSFFAVHFLPCMAWGFNLKRAFKHSMLLHATLYFLLLMGSGYLMMGANHAEDRLCPHGPVDEASLYGRMAGPDADVHSNRKLLHVHRRLAEAGVEISGADPSTAAAAMFEAADQDDEAALMEILDADEAEELAELEDEDDEEEVAEAREDADEDDEEDEEDEREHRKPKHGPHRKHHDDDDDDDDEDEEEHHKHHHEKEHKEHHGKEKGHGCHKHKPHPHPPPPEPVVPWGELPQECRRAIVAKHASLAWGLLCSLLGIAYCAAHRTQLRQKFGIAGSRLGDCCTWLWCAPCALCQETRTLWVNNVHEGVWHGRAPQQLLPATSPPPAQAVAAVAPKTV